MGKELCYIPYTKCSYLIHVTTLWYTIIHSCFTDSKLNLRKSKEFVWGHKVQLQTQVSWTPKTMLLIYQTASFWIKRIKKVGAWVFSKLKNKTNTNWKTTSVFFFFSSLNHYIFLLSLLSSFSAWHEPRCTSVQNGSKNDELVRTCL